MRTIPASELAIHSDGSVFHLHLKPEQLADRVVLVGDPARVTTVASYFDSQECEVSSREFHTITGQYKGKRITVVSHGIGTDNIDIVLNELDALANIDFSTRTIFTAGIQATFPGSYRDFRRVTAICPDRDLCGSGEIDRIRRGHLFLRK